jgi:outer membrane protein OmpA-like peptidoglycan-associated protein
MRKLIFSTLLASVLAGGAARAQHLLGLSNSNYAGVNGIYLNPSSIADSRFGFHLNFFTVDGYFTNSHYQYSGPYSLRKMARNNFEGEYGFKDEYITGRDNDRNKLGQFGGDARFFPSFMLKLSPRHSIALTGRTRFIGNVNNISDQLIDNIENGDKPDYQNKPFNNSTGSLNVNVFAETGLTYARVILDNDQHFLKGGLTVKRLSGLYSAYAHLKALDYSINENADGDIKLRADNLDLQYGYSRTDFDDVEENELADALTFKAPGNGWGFDVGLTYEFRPDIDKYRYTMDGKEKLDNRKNKYKYRVGVALMDLGGIKYAQAQHVRTYNIVRRNYDIPLDSLDGLDGGAMDKVFNVQPGERGTSFKAGLPSALHLNFDYRLANKIYVNAAIIQNLRGKYAVGSRFASVASVTPRIEMKWFELSTPVTLFNNYQQFAVGSMVKLGPLFVGSDNLMAVAGLGKPFGADVYMGLTLPIYKGKKRDKDKDGVSNRKDDCKTVAGVWDFKGCPDSDADGVQDKDDKCPLEAGKQELGGCPDKDNDNITDADDKCPEVAGLAQFGGCPDTDRDGITDAEDTCPEAAGPPEHKGCPDRDGDGIVDKDDKCADEKGLAQFNGCADNDNDGIANPDDACPEAAGTAAFKGCPDRDGDGVQDKGDQCPDVAGPASNNGCPVPVAPAAPAKVEEVKLTQEEAKVVKEAFSDLEFENGKAVIKQESLSSLDELSDLLITRPYRLLLSGHTDNVGNAAANVKLSKSRAEAVKAYLLKVGVAGDKVITEGWGSKKPIASNKTPQGRQKNRRVEFKIIK